MKKFLGFVLISLTAFSQSIFLPNGKEFFISYNSFNSYNVKSSEIGFVVKGNNLVLGLSSPPPALLKGLNFFYGAGFSTIVESYLGFMAGYMASSVLQGIHYGFWFSFKYNYSKLSSSEILVAFIEDAKYDGSFMYALSVDQMFELKLKPLVLSLDFNIYRYCMGQYQTSYASSHKFFDGVNLILRYVL